MLDRALVGPELAATFLCIVIRLGYAHIALQNLVELLADLDVVEPTTGDRFLIVRVKLLANNFESMSDFSCLLDVIDNIVLRQGIVF